MTSAAFPAELLSQHIAIVGKTGSGKTYSAKGFVERLLTDKRRVCILDPTGVWYGLRSSADGKKPGFAVAVFGGRHADVAIAEHSGAAVAKIVAEKNLPAIIDLSEMLIGQRHRFVTDFAEALYRDNRAPLHLVVDEADEFAPQNPLPETKRMLHHVDRIVRRGRVRGFRVMLITQRPAVLHKNVLTQANALIAMRLTAPQDRKAIQAWVEGQADEGEAREVLASLARLQRGEGWVWAPELGLLNRTTFPKIATFDSGRTPDDDEVVVEPSKLATVDLAEVKASMQAVEQELKTVKELQAELARVKQQLEASQKAKGGIAESEVRRRIREAVAAVPREAVADPGAIKALQQIAKLVAPYSGVRIEGVALGPVVREAKVAPAPRQRDAPVAAGPVTAGLSASQQRILDSLAALEAFGVPAPAKETLAAHAGATNTSSGYRNNLSTLRTAGLLEYPTPGAATLTEAGRRAANAPTTKPTLRELHEGWLRLLSGSQSAILSKLIEVYPRSVEKAALAEMVGATATSSGYRNNLSRLRTMRAIDYPQPGTARANDILFPGGK